MNRQSGNTEVSGRHPLPDRKDREAGGSPFGGFPVSAAVFFPK